MKRFFAELATYDRLLKNYPIYGNVRRYLIFLLGGGSAYLVAMLTTTLLKEVFHVWFAFSYASGLVLAIIITFLYHRHITFKKGGEWKHRFLKFNVVVISIVILNWIFVLLSINALKTMLQIADVAPIQYWGITFLITLVLSIMNFSLNKLWVFK